MPQPLPIVGAVLVTVRTQAVITVEVFCVQFCDENSIVSRSPIRINIDII